MKRSAALAAVSKGSLCAGCGLCEALAPDAVKGRVQEPGYLRPVQTAELERAQEEAIAETCPGLEVSPWEGRASQVDPYWGPIRECHTGYAKDGEVRFRCSSGGAISALAIHALEAGLVDLVIHTTADPANPIGNMTRISRSRSEVLDGAGSRYAPSSPLREIMPILDGQQRALFIGKPCDVSALRQLAKFDERVNQRIPYMLSFFCGGIPSHKGAHDIVEELGLAARELKRFDYRGNGWPGLTVAETESGESAEMTYERSWGKHLSSQVQFRCKICPDPVGGVADIACADAWYGGESGYPQFDEAEGRSLIVARTEAGRALLSQAGSADAVATEPLDVREIDLMQPAQARRKRLIWARMKAWQLALRPVPEMAGLRVGEATRKSPVLALAKEFAGTLRRIIAGRI